MSWLSIWNKAQATGRILTSFIPASPRHSGAMEVVKPYQHHQGRGGGGRREVSRAKVPRMHSNPEEAEDRMLGTQASLGRHSESED